MKLTDTQVSLLYRWRGRNRFNLNLRGYKESGTAWADLTNEWLADTLEAIGRREERGKPLVAYRDPPEGQLKWLTRLGWSADETRSDSGLALALLYFARPILESTRIRLWRRARPDRELRPREKEPTPKGYSPSGLSSATRFGTFAFSEKGYELFAEMEFGSPGMSGVTPSWSWTSLDETDQLSSSEPSRQWEPDLAYKILKLVAEAKQSPAKRAAGAGAGIDADEPDEEETSFELHEGDDGDATDGLKQIAARGDDEHAVEPDPDEERPEETEETLERPEEDEETGFRPPVECPLLLPPMLFLDLSTISKELSSDTPCVPPHFWNAARRGVAISVEVDPTDTKDVPVSVDLHLGLVRVGAGWKLWWREVATDHGNSSQKSASHGGPGRIKALRDLPQLIEKSGLYRQLGMKASNKKRNRFRKQPRKEPLGGGDVLASDGFRFWFRARRR